MLFTRAISAIVAGATLFQQCAAQEDRRLPALIDRGVSPVERSLESRDTCADGGRCFIGRCCGDGCASNCCGHDNGGVGCGIAERCDFSGNVFIGCCNIAAIGGCTGTATQITINTPYRTVTFNTGRTSTTADIVPTASAEQTFTLPTVDSSQPTATGAPSTATTPSTESTPTRTPTPTESETPSDESTELPSATEPADTTLFAQTTTSQGIAPMITAFVPAEVNMGALAALGAWMVL